MIETIPLSKLSKSYINNHDVICNGIHCRYIEREYGFGRVEGEYEVFGSKGINDIILTFSTLKELKKYLVHRNVKYV